MPDVKPWDDLKDALIGIVKESIPELMDVPLVPEFVAQQSALFAEEKYLSLTADNPQEREEHAENLKHLVAQVNGAAMESAIREDFRIKEKLGRTLKTVGVTLLKILPGFFGINLG